MSDVTESGTEIHVRHTCQSCGGTGLYSGFMEPNGVARVCTGCGGFGFLITIHKKWSGSRPPKANIHQVITPEGTTISIGEFNRRYK